MRSIEILRFIFIIVKRSLLRKFEEICFGFSFHCIKIAAMNIVHICSEIIGVKKLVHLPEGLAPC